MSATAPASPPPTASKPRVLTLEQESFVREFTKTYGLEPHQISFDSDRLEPIFDFDALNLLAHALGNFPRIATDLDRIEESTGVVTSTCEIRVHDGRERSVVGAALIGEVLPNSSIISDYQQALNVAQARALRKALRAVGWDALRAHREQGDNTLTFNPTPESTMRNNELAEIHILAKDIGLIDEQGDKTKYYKMLGIWFPSSASIEGYVSADSLDDIQRVQAIAMLRGLKQSNVSVGATPNAALRANAEAAAKQ